jgi:pSer/pThr/pTyr-binding forkhead associated (FHA) protein
MTLSLVKASLTVERGANPGKEFTLSIGDNLVGRWDAENSIFPEVDLDEEDLEAKVSRRHVRISIHSEGAMIEDLGSTNGTYVNRGKRLLPGEPAPLKDGDELILGKLTLRFRHQPSEATE